MEGAMEDRPSTHTLTSVFGRELWNVPYGGKKSSIEILQKRPSMEINKRPYINNIFNNFILKNNERKINSVSPAVRFCPFYNGTGITSHVNRFAFSLTILKL